MNFAATRRKHIAWNIQQNPVEILIRRTEKVDKGGYFDEEESTHGPFTVRIFTARSNIPQTVTTLAGSKQTDIYYSLLADEQADIKAGPRVKDEFHAWGDHFRVTAVYPQVVHNEVVGYQADLERIQ